MKGTRESMRVALIGCGAIAERYADVLAGMDVQRIAAVDVDNMTARDFQRKHGFKASYTNYRDIFGNADCAIICLPNHLHSSVSVELLRNGIGVLCEKPIATAPSDALHMVQTARESQAVLAAGNIRRYYWSSVRVKKMFEEEEFGLPLSIEAEEGVIFGWKTRSGFFFDKSKSGGGVLIDIGSHMLDLVLWWLRSYPTSLKYCDDNQGGVEADAEAEFVFPDGLQLTVRLSWLRQLSNVYRIRFDHATVWYWPHDYNRIAISMGDDTPKVFNAPKWQPSEGYFGLMVHDFLDSVQNRRKPFVSGEEVEPSIRLVDQCYKKRTKLELPWLKSTQG